ncbi:MAG: AMP-binding protein [Clostridia bacterium]|nr:AMP-binding protein [Clostridia bacterium]
MNLNTLYSKFPGFIQNIGVSAYGLVREYRRFGGEYKNHFKRVIDTEFCSREELKRYQSNELSVLFKAAKTSKYYSGILNEIEKTTTDPFEILKKMPVLEKDSLRGHEEDFYTEEAKGALVFHTSGSTGTPLNIKMCKSDFRLRMALLERQKQRFGVNHKSKHLTFVGKKITSGNSKTFWRYNIFGHQLVMSVYDLAEGNRDLYISKIVKYNPEVVEGYPSALGVIASWLKAGNIKLKTRCVLVTAETLSDENKKVIEEGFGCPVVNYYGSTEGATMITQCEKGKLHIDDESGIIEFVNHNGEAAAPGEEAEMLITSFTSKAMPLIRYNIRDMAIISTEGCTCGRCSTVISEIIGRTDDMFVTPEKGHVGRLSTSLKLLPGTVRRAQIHQYTPTDFTLLIESDTQLEAQQIDIVLADLKDKLGKVKIKVEYVNHIPDGKNGKFRSQINHCKIVR